MTDRHTPDDFLYGAEAIREFLGKRSTRQIYYLAERGLIPVARLGRELVGRRSRLLAHIDALEVAPISGQPRALAGSERRSPRAA